MKVAVTGAAGLLGWHASARLHAENCAARYRGERPPHELVLLDRKAFADPAELCARLRGVEAILHFAGVNRGSDDEVRDGNPAIARQLVDAARKAGIAPRIVYANSTHAQSDTLYGNSKRIAGEIAGEFAAERFVDLVLPHIFGECARPRYNNVTATLIDDLWHGREPAVNPQGRVNLLHAGEAAQIAIDAALHGRSGRIVPLGRDMSIPDLHELLKLFRDQYARQVFPNLADPFELALFNAYRTGAYPAFFPRQLPLHADHRGVLFESAKGGHRPQTFLSTTLPGMTRGDHFHIDLVERFLVVSGEAVIRIRKVLTDEVHEFAVSGAVPVAIDMPPLHTHHIENVGAGELVTFFWSHRIFDPTHPDTFADPVKART